MGLDKDTQFLFSILVIAVSIGPSVLFYRNMKPYYKYTVPSLPINPIEKEVWQKVSTVLCRREVDLKFPFRLKLLTEKPENIESQVNQLRRLHIGELSRVSQKLVTDPPADLQVLVHVF